MSLIIAADTGGTFTDLAAYNRETGQLHFTKSLTTYEDLVQGLLRCIEKAGIDLRKADLIKFGTTLVINTYVMRTGARSALVTTKGFKDVLELRRGNRAKPFDIRYARHPPLISRELRFEVDERTDSEGEVIRLSDQREIDGLADLLAKLGVEAVAVSLINSYKNPESEQHLTTHLRKKLPNVYVSAGTDISREWHEYERTSTAVANAYVGPKLSEYIDSLDVALRTKGFTKTFYLMASNGGIASIPRARKRPVTLVESGPVGGIVGAGAYGIALGIDKIVGFDMGGTTAKCAVIENGRFAVKSPYYVGGPEYGFPVRGGVLDIVEVGAGGGSIASVDAFGRLSVGPLSAGSEPGPICYRRGGTQPTITDANVVLGRIDPKAFLGGEMELDVEAAQSAIGVLAAKLGLTGEYATDEMAQGILDLAAFTMSSAVQQITIEQGLDPRDYTMVAFGGGGPLHSASLAKELGMAGVIIPHQPGVFSALGMILSGARIDETETFIRPLSTAAVLELAKAFEDLERRVAAEITEELGQIEISFERYTEMRFKGQQHTVRTAFASADATEIAESFKEEYKRRFGHASDAPIEFISLVSVATSQLEKLTPDQLYVTNGVASNTVPPCRTRTVYFPEVKRRLPTAVFNRCDLPLGFHGSGPALIEEYGSTSVVGPTDTFRIGNLGELRIGFDKKDRYL